MKYILFATLAALSLAVSAQQIYKWTDDKGVTHYGQTPPANVKATVAGIKVDHAPASANAAVAAQRAPEDKAKAQRAAACRSGLAQITAIQSQRQTYQSDGKGNRVVLRDAAAEARVREAQIQMRKNCDE
jgi:Domain of unknown function (DUF4124)